MVAAENFWGSIAAQLGGNRVHVTSVITSPATDPHDYEPTAADARTMAGAQLAIVNGIGYDPWADKLLAANPVDGRVVLTVGDLVGIKPGGNPHRWYSPADVQKVIDEIVRDYTKLDPKDAAYFKQQKARFETRGLAQYKRLIATIKRKYHGVPVGASESIFAPLAQALGLEAADAAVLPEGDQRRHRADRARQDDDRPPDRDAGRSRSGSSTARTARPTCSGSPTPPARRASR